MDKEHAQLLASEYADDLCSVCDHVLNGAEITTFVHKSNEYIAACSTTCLDGDLQVTKMSQIIDRDPKVVHVLHIPVNVFASLVDTHWELSLFERNYQPLADDFLYASRNPEDFDKTEFYFWVLRFSENALHYIGYDTGIKFVPIFKSADWAKSALSLFARLYHRLLFLPVQNICELSREDNRNYIGIVGKEHIECIIVDRIIMLE